MSLHKEPSFSVFNDPSSDGPVCEGREREELESIVTIGQSIEREFSFENNVMGLIEEDSEEEKRQEQVLNGIDNLGFGDQDGERSNGAGSEPLCLASGIGVGGVGFENLSLPNFEEESDLQEYYKKMVEQCPFHPLFLRNYAQLLQSKGDLYGAEEYYSRASLADPEDGKIWMQYAKLVWDLHRDKDRASSYFKFATEAAPKDCNILAAYASFLWEIEDGEKNDEMCQDHLQKETIDQLDILSPKKDQASIVEGIGTDMPDSINHGSRNPENLEDCYRKIIDDNPNNALSLGNYAKFLYESKEDLQGAEEYYSRAVLADPGDGQLTAQYANLVWELHHDRHKAAVYFERAVQASPENSDVLAAYASFLWENEDDEDNELNKEDQVQDPSSHKQSATPANV